MFQLYRLCGVMRKSFIFVLFFLFVFMGPVLLCILAVMNLKNVIKFTTDADCFGVISSTWFAAICN